MHTQASPPTWLPGRPSPTAWGPAHICEALPVPLRLNQPPRPPLPQGKKLPPNISEDAEEGEVSDEDSADEMDEDCKLLNGDVSGGRGVRTGERGWQVARGVCWPLAAGHTHSPRPQRPLPQHRSPGPQPVTRWAGRAVA